VIADVGSMHYLVGPRVRKEKLYDFRQVAKCLQQEKLRHPFMIGAGAGPFDYVGVNCEVRIEFWCSLMDHFRNFGAGGSGGLINLGIFGDLANNFDCVLLNNL
jgi:hypothetical protein